MYKFLIVNSMISKIKLSEIILRKKIIKTPSFIFCATYMSVKSLDLLSIHKNRSQVILCNIYHIIKNMDHVSAIRGGGIHKFINWSDAIITDSGGFQIFSIGNSRKKNMDNILFDINVNGASLNNRNLTPEKSINVQKSIVPELIFCFDECIPYYFNRKYTKISTSISHNWISRSYLFFMKNIGVSLLYGIIQGGVHIKLRKNSCFLIQSKIFFGQGIGGSIGNNEMQMESTLLYVFDNINTKVPIHLLGIGKTYNLIRLSLLGIDTFDCVHPIRVSRHYCALVRFSSKEYINISNSSYTFDFNPLDICCKCNSCLNYSKSYIHCLINNNNKMFQYIICGHNSNFINNIFYSIRKKIISFMY